VCIVAEKALDDAARAVHAEFFGQAITSEGADRPARPAKKRAAKSAKGRAARA
jgi:hypothetical protein